MHFYTFLKIFVLRCDPRNIFASVFSFTMTICKRLTNRRIIHLAFWLLGNGGFDGIFNDVLVNVNIKYKGELIQSQPNVQKESVSSNGRSGSLDVGKTADVNERDVNKIAH
jgi:hypothetical protein